MAPVRNLLCIFQRLKRIGKECRHFFLRFHIILSAFIAHPVFIGKLLSRLQAQQNIVGLFILRVSIMYVVCRHQFNSGFLRKPKKLLIHDRLFRNSMVLKFQKEIPLSENLLITKRCLSSFVVKSSKQIFLNLSRKARAECNDSLVILLQNLIIHPRFIVVTLCKSAGHDLHQIGVSRIIFGKQHQMIVSVFIPPHRFFIKAGTGSNIDLASQHRINPCSTRGTVEFNDAEHHAVICDRSGCHAKFFHSVHIFFDLIGTVQQTVFCMDM